MTEWATLPPEVREAMHAVCTPDEIDTLKLYAGGMGYRRIASALGITRDTARNRVDRALNKIRRHLEAEHGQDPPQDEAGRDPSGDRPSGGQSPR
jgi:DNA-directed RNA polymerase specialized sigma24 family protein